MTATIVVDTTTSNKSSSTDGAANVPVTNTSLNKYNFLNLLAYIVNISVTFSIGVNSSQYITIVNPFGLAFSIDICICMAVWVLWQFSPSQRNSDGVERAWYYYSIMTIFQAGWTVSFSYDIIWLALISMYGIVITLVMASMSLQKYSKTWKGYLLWQCLISIQTGWIIAAAAKPRQMILDQFTAKQINGVQLGVLAGLCLVSFGISVKALYVLLKQRLDAMKKTIEEEEGNGSSASASNLVSSSEEEAV